MAPSSRFDTGAWVVNAARIVVSASVLGLTLWSAVSANSMERQFLQWTALCLMAFSLPLFSRLSFDLLIAQLFLLLLIFHGVILRTVFLIGSGIDTPEVVHDLLKWGSADSTLEGIRVSALAGLGISTGFLALSPFFSERRDLCGTELTRQRDKAGILARILGLGCLISGTGFFLMVHSLGVNLANPAKWSAIRFIVSFSDADQKTYLESAGYGAYRIANLAKIFFYAGVIHLAMGSFSKKSAATVFCLFCGFLAVLVPVFVGSRINAGLVFFDAAVLGLILGAAIRPGLLLAGGTITLVLAGSIFASRSGAGSLETSLHSFVGNRDLLDVVKTGEIVENVPATLPFLNGETLYGWAALPIPRSIWPDKPISIEQASLIDIHIFGGGGLSGTPPGFIAEMFWNFGTTGVILGSLVLGLALGLISVFYRRWSAHHLVRALHGLLAVRIALFVAGNSVGVGLLKIALELGPLLFLLLLIHALEARRRGSRSGLETTAIERRRRFLGPPPAQSA